MKTFLRSMIKKTWIILLVCTMVVARMEVFTNTATANADDARYTVVYERFEQLRRGALLKPSEAYNQYGSMNGDYYVIVMEENLRYLNGDKDIHFQDLNAIMDSLKKMGIFLWKPERSCVGTSPNTTSPKT